MTLPRTRHRREARKRAKKRPKGRPSHFVALDWFTAELLWILSNQIRLSEHIHREYSR